MTKATLILKNGLIFHVSLEGDAKRFSLFMNHWMQGVLISQYDKELWDAVNEYGVSYKVIISTCDISAIALDVHIAK